MITLVKSFVDEKKTQKKINIRKIVSMKEVIDKPIKEVKIKLKDSNDIQKLDKLSLDNGQTKVFIDVDIEKKKLTFELSKNRKIDHKMLDLLKKHKNIEIN